MRHRGAQTPLAANSRRSSAAELSFLLASSSCTSSLPNSVDSTGPLATWCDASMCASPSKWLGAGVPRFEDPWLAEEVSSSTCASTARDTSGHGDVRDVDVQSLQLEGKLRAGSNGLLGLMCSSALAQWAVSWNLLCLTIEGR